MARRSGASSPFRGPIVIHVRPVPLPEHLLEILVCPRCKQRLIYFPRGEAGESEAAAFLLCPGERLRYAVADDGFPVLMIDEAASVRADEVTRMVARARALGLAVPE